MKTITMYELLGLVKDSKAPKKIKWGDTKYTLYIDEYTKQTYYQDDECRLFFLNIKCLDDLNDEVEILEEEKKIPEKLDHLIGYDIQQFDDLKEYVEITTNDLFGKVNKVIDTLNQVIDYLKSKGE